MLKRHIIVSAIFVGAILSGRPGVAASDVSNSGGVSVQATTAVVAPVASSQTAGLISGAISSGLGGGGGGGFVPKTGGSGGGFTPGSGSGPGAPGAYAPNGNFNVASSETPSSPFTSTRSGRAAGDPGTDFGLWTQATASHISKSEDALKMHGNIYNAVVGLDRKLPGNTLVGLALSLESSDIVTAYNNGHFEGNGVSVASYFGVQLTPQWTLDVLGGYGWLRYDVDRAGGAISGSYDATRLFAASNLTGGFASGDWRFQPTIGVQWSREHQMSYQETGNVTVDASNSTSGRLSGGTKVGYALENGIPYVKVMGEWDFLTPDAVLKSNGGMSQVDRYGGVIGIGYEHYMGNFIGSAEVNYNSLLRQDLDLWTGVLRLRWDF